MYRKKYSTFTQRELDGGINLDSSPNEIDNKQCVLANNFNSEGNKLVSAKNISKLYSHPATDGTPSARTAQGIFKKGDDIWTIYNGTVYKNGTLQYKNNAYTLALPTIDFNVLSIGINGTNYTYQFSVGNENTARNQFASALQTSLGSNFVVSHNSGFLNIENIYFNPIIFNLSPNIVKQVQLNGWNRHARIDIIVDGITVSLLGSTYPVLTDALDFLATSIGATNYYTKRTTDSLYIGRKDAVAPVITSTQYNRYTYALRTLSTTIEGTPPRNTLGGSDSQPSILRNIKATVDGTLYTWTSQSTSWTSSSITHTYTGLVVPNYSVGNKDTYYVGIFDIIANALNISSLYTVEALETNPVSGVDRYSYYIPVRKNDYSTMSLTTGTISYFISGTTFADTTPFANTSRLNLVETNNLASITVTNYNIFSSSTLTNTGTQFDRGYEYRIFVSEYCELFTREGVNPIVYINGVRNVITTAGNPTLGIVYNGKTILAGYGDDRIFFSKTANPTNTSNLIDFSGYSAGSQYIVGDRVPITGLLLGENGLYVFKEDSVWYTSTENDTGSSFNFIFNKISSTGALSQETIIDIGQDIFYLDYKSRRIRRLSYEQNLTTLRDSNVSDEVGEILDSIPKDNEATNERFTPLMQLSYKYPNLKFAYPDSSALNYFMGFDSAKKYRVPNKTLTYNVSNKSWFTEDSKDYTNKRPLFSSYDVFTTENGDVYEDDVGYAVSGQFLSKDYDLGESVGLKRYGKFDLYGTNSSGATIFLDVYRNGTLHKTYTIPAGTEIRTRVDLFMESRYLRFGIRYVGASKIEINDFSIEFKPIGAISLIQS